MSYETCETRCDSLTRFLSDFIPRSLTVLTSFPASLLVNNFSIPPNLSGGFFLVFFLIAVARCVLRVARSLPQWVLNFYYFVFPTPDRFNQLSLIRDTERVRSEELEKNVWGGGGGGVGGWGAVMEVKGEWEMSKDRSSADGGVCGGAGGEEGERDQERVTAR